MKREAAAAGCKDGADIKRLEFVITKFAGAGLDSTHSPPATSRRVCVWTGTTGWSSNTQTRRGVGCTIPYGYVSILGETGQPTLGWKEGSGALPE